ncbi:uncharacterized protein LOC124160772 [Ischnura elegans]|uniref:uncharacterized protein LOC124160772 n=1 Tax=Ischnura elegans TaxID=197161 RepID=UPI001ED86F21|nr:uncharacterized protein LOC124160772 [Ischnura elegans]XP_046392759.1 uncharacterized protein LOC124160772 [Ischnura elegans]XP_046392760.1 uncharacterized protein LOC124160772 [Ischnura elegans]XP_046392761.1 uncharacterized protein LOC124160772 [Ischnura elegans]XP_046392762.1 uncharacterized protein LOC124160772 [Ischnura elegans]XP_046392763.1 uncharacterized protein LOC124160772 [Ischnura elegans]
MDLEVRRFCIIGIFLLLSSTWVSAVSDESGKIVSDNFIQLEETQETDANVSSFSTDGVQELSMMSTLGPPPAGAFLKFEFSDYSFSFHVGFLGVLEQLKAIPHPPNLTQWGEIKYGLKNVPDGISGSIAIKTNGQLVVEKRIEQGSYSFDVTAQIVSITSEAIASVTYNSFIPIDVCGNGTTRSLILETPFISKTVEENTPYHQIVSFSSPKGYNCSIQIVEENPSAGWFIIDVMPYIGYIEIYLDDVNREDPIFKGAIEPVVSLQANITCVEFKGVSDGSLSDSSVAEASTAVGLEVHIKDVNDNWPKFKQDYVVIGYPVKEIADVEFPDWGHFAEAQDSDTEEYASITYSCPDTNEVIIDPKTGYLYPHPKNFNYNNVYFEVLASDGAQNSSMTVDLIILSASSLVVLRVPGRLPHDTLAIVEELSEATGFSVGALWARLVPDEGGPFDSESDKPLGDPSYSLSILAYALNDDDGIDADLFVSRLEKLTVGGRPIFATPYGRTAKDDRREVERTALITVSVVLFVVVVGVMAFELNRYISRKKKRARQGRIIRLPVGNANLNSQDNTPNTGPT